MSLAATTRLGIPQYQDSEQASFSAQVDAISKRLDAIVMRFEEGAGALPERAAGIAGSYWLAKGGSKAGAPEGDLYYDTGAAWVGPRNRVAGPPLGSLMDYALPGDPADPDGVTRWLVADGRAISRTTYAALFAKVSAEQVEGKTLLSIWGEGNGTTTFNIPNFTGKTAVMPGGSGVTRLGSTGGEEKHALTAEENGAHTHGVNDPGHAHGVNDPGHAHSASTAFGQNGGALTTEAIVGWARFTPIGSGGDVLYTGYIPISIAAAGTGISIAGAGTGVSVAGQGAGKAHNNMQPYVGVNKIIRVL